MPPWGRPSGARRAKRRKDRGVYTQQREEDLRFKEIDSDSDDGQGVTLGGTFTSDELQFTGADLGTHLRSRQSRSFRYDSDTSEDEDIIISDNSGGMMQLALRDKEELLVEKALERIRRAQALGKPNVKLSKPELDALERKRRKDQSERKTSVTNLRSTDKRRSSGAPIAASKDPKSRKQSRKSSVPRHDRQDVSSPEFAAVAPGILLSGRDGPSYARFGYYPSNSDLQPVAHLETSPRSPSLSYINQNAPKQTKARDSHKRKSSGLSPAQQSPSLDVSDPSRHLPDDPRWIPRPRSASSNHAYAMGPYQYQQYSPPLPQVPYQYSQNRRIVSGPPDVHYPDVQYLNASRASFRNQQPQAASSEPSLLHREATGPPQNELLESDEESGGSDDHGVQVDVVPYGQGYSVRVDPGSGTDRQR